VARDTTRKEGGADRSVLVMQGKTAFGVELPIGVGNNKGENIDKGRGLQ
jgi:hypothetical protein